MSAGIGIGSLATLTGVVFFGSVIPIVPTGVAVSVAAAVADRDPVVIAIVVAFSALGAYVGDILTYAALRIFGDSLVERVSWLRRWQTGGVVTRLRAQMDEHELSVLLTSRLIPAGRIPVLIAAALGRYPLRRFITADILAAALWSVLYAAIGVAGRAIFPQPWEAAVAAVVLIVVITGLNAWWGRRRATREAGRVSPGAGSGHPDTPRTHPDTP